MKADPGIRDISTTVECGDRLPPRRSLAMYTLHWALECGSFAPHAALNEVGASYELVKVDLGSEQHHAPEFLAVNPRAQVPVLTLPDGTVMTESVAMVMHIADCHRESSLMPGIGETDRAIAYRWLMFSAVNLYETGCRISDPHHYSENEPDYEGIRAKGCTDLDRYWDMVVDAIRDGPFFLGQRFSAVDICLLMIAQWHFDSETLLKRHPKLVALCDATRNRPAVKKVWDLNFELD